ncbi:MAG TPA: hypothetical protein VGM69_08500 [Chloroflexota bacterium]|jgi:hypothetical protein
MNGFAPPVLLPRASTPDATRHVNFTLGMVLGVDDFTQEFAYLSGRDQWLARDLLGYGTVCGLRVGVERDARGPRLVVEPGTALTPRGQMVRVPSRQCAYLNEWFAARDQAVSERIGSPPGVRLYVVLCYRECLTDDVPIPGEPCRSEEESKAPSRVADDYLLELRFAPPEQAEEDALRDFVAWLRQVELTEVGAEAATLEAFLDAIRVAAGAGSPPSPPDVMLGSPPSTLRIPAADACEFLRAAFRLWTTEIRRSWPGAEPSRAGAPPDEECVLLAAVDVPVVREPPNWRVSDPDRVVLLEDRRPYVLSLRLLQEWALCGPRGGGGGAIPEVVSPGGPSPSGTVREERSFGAAASAGSAAAFARGDHTHGTPPDPIPPHRTAPDAHTLSGDVTGPIGSAIVERILGVPIAQGALLEGQVLTVRGGQWRAETAPAGPDGAFVAHPPDAGAYSIVAAGRARGDGAVAAPTYNKLEARVMDDGQLLVTFTGYRRPVDGRGGDQYVVKALPVFNKDVQARLQIRGVLVAFDRFEDDGLVLWVSDGAEPVGRDRLAELECMVEISQFAGRLI